MTNLPTKIIMKMQHSELEEILASAFESHREKGYFYMDCGGRHHGDWINIYDKILSSFNDDQRKFLEQQVQSTMSRPGIHRIMDQGCGHAQSLREVTVRLASHYPQNKFIGYGLSGSLKDIWLGGRKFDFHITSDQQRLIKVYGIQPFQEKGENYEFFGVEDDLHTVMLRFPYLLDLVVSDNTYFHLAVPWLALKRTVDKLTMGGIALIRTLFNSKVNTFTQKVIADVQVLNNLRKDNVDYEVFSVNSKQDHRVLAIIKRGDNFFKTNLYLGWVEEEGYKKVKLFYSRKPQLNLLAVDNFQ